MNQAMKYTILIMFIKQGITILALQEYKAICIAWIY